MANVRLKILLFIVGSFLFMGLLKSSAYAQHTAVLQRSPREKILFDFNWRFHLGGAQGAQRFDFDVSQWRNINLPHDWSIEDLGDTGSPLDSNAVSQVYGGFTVGGEGWYRKQFSVSDARKGKLVWIQFDGVYMNADVWLNGHHLGTHPYGYTSFWYNVTDYIKYGEDNLLAVQVKNMGKNSRWYSGSGIYRHVWLTFVDPIHAAHWGVAISTPIANEQRGKINIKTAVKNETATLAKVTLITHILDASGNELKKVISHQDISTGGFLTFDQDINIVSPSLWSVSSPYLYTAVTEVYSNKELFDKLETKFGIRRILFDASNGFRLNGKYIKLKGGGVHSDNGPLGARSFDRAEVRKVALMKNSGFNAIRCAHNPPSPAFLAACDSLGMLVIDEAFDMWEDLKTPFDYHLYFNKWWKRDMKSILLRDRNHPSVIMWSIGNEIPNKGSKSVDSLAKLLADYVRDVDATRPVTSAVNGISPKMDKFVSALDVCGYNYELNHYLIDHKRKPKRVMVATESFPLYAFDYWMAVRDYPWVIGDFVWTGFGYLGEASIGWRVRPPGQNFYPWHLAYCGDIDVCGWKRPQSYYRDVLWKKNQLSIFVKTPKPSFSDRFKEKPAKGWGWDDVAANWNWSGHENDTFEVDIYSSCEDVELFLNGKSLGKKTTNRSTKYMAKWKVLYQPGELKVIGFSNSMQVAESELKTAGKVSDIRLSADRTDIKANGQDLSYVTIELCDKNGIRNPIADNLIHFKIDGPGSIVGVGNANPLSTESYQLPQRKAWRGRCLVIIKSHKIGGAIKLTASSEDLPSSSIIINSNK